MKQQISNTFGEGLMMDLNPLTTQNNILTNCLNGTLITNDGNEFILQNDLGNGRVEKAKLPSGFVPLGIKEYGGIIYVVAYNPISNISQIGSFPSPERLISSDETSIPEIKIVDEDFWNNKDYSHYGFFSEYFKTGNITENILKPGDEFLIALGTTNERNIGELLKVLTHYVPKRDENNNIISWDKKRLLFNVRLGLITSDGTIQYIEDSLIRFNITEEAKHWAPIISSAPEQFLSIFKNQFQNQDVYNIYKENISGNIVFVVELESLEDFSIIRQIEVNDIDNSYNVKFVNISSNNNDESEHYNEKVQLEGIEVEFNMVETDNENPSVLPSNIHRIQRLKDKKDISIKLSNFKQDLLNVSDILKYKITPYSKYGKYDRFTKQGIIDFKYVNSGKHFLNEFRYFVSNNSINISYGIDYYPKEGYSVKEVYFELYDISNDYSTYYKCKEQSNYSGNFNENIDFSDKPKIEYIPKKNDTNKHYELQHNRVIKKEVNGQNVDVIYKSETNSTPSILPNNLYLVRICINELDENEKNVYTNYYRFMYTTSFFNKYYIENEVLDFADLTLDGELDADIKSNYSYSHEINEESKYKYYEIYDDLDYNSKTPLQSHTIADYTLGDKLTVVPKMKNDDSQNKIHKYFGDFNSEAIQITESNVVGNPKLEYKPILKGLSEKSLVNKLDELMEENKDRLANSDGSTNDVCTITHTQGTKDLFLQIKAKLNRFIVSTKDGVIEKINTKIFEPYLNEKMLNTESEIEINKKVFGISKSDSGDVVLANTIAANGGEKGGAAKFYYGTLTKDVENVGNDENKDDLYMYRNRMRVHINSAKEFKPSDQNSHNLSEGVSAIVKEKYKYLPTIAPLNLFSYNRLDGSIETGMNQKSNYTNDLRSYFTSYKKNEHKGRNRFTPTDYSRDSSPILLLWKSEYNINPNLPKYVALNFYGYRGGVGYDGGNYRNFTGNDRGHHVDLTNSFSQKLLNILDRFYLVQYKYKLFKLYYPKNILYTDSTNDNVEVGIKINTTLGNNNLYTFNRTSNKIGKNNIPLSIIGIKSILLNNDLNLPNSVIENINFDNIDLKRENFNLDNINLTLNYEFGYDIDIDSTLDGFNNGKQGIINMINSDIVLIDGTEVRQNPLDGHNNLINQNNIYIKDKDNKYYDIDSKNFGKLFWDKENVDFSNIDGRYQYNADYYGNLKNIFISTYASKGVELNTLNEPLIRESMLTQSYMPGNTNDQRVDMWLWTNGSKTPSDPQEHLSSMNSYISIMRMMAFDPLYEILIPYKNPAITT